MTDIKKVSLTSAPSNKVERKEVKRKRTVRILLTLPESNEKSCPEFNYGDLLSQHLHRRLGKERLGDVINGPLREDGDPNASDEDEALRALARQFEKKYGGGPRRRKNKKENDFKQLGEGYDETDPFIDNSDAVDDVLATNMETKFGGFYINSGLLKFEEVQVSEDEESDGSGVQNVKKRRQIEISSSDEEENRNEVDKNDTKIRENGVLLKAKKRKLDEGEMLRRRKKMIDKFNAKKQKQKQLNEDTSENEMDSKLTEGPLEESKAMNGTSIAESIEAVVSKAREGTVLVQTRSPEEPASSTVAVSAKEDEPVREDETLREDEAVKEDEIAEDEEVAEEEEDDDDEREDEKDESSTSESSSASSSESSSSESDSDDDKDDKESGKEEVEKKVEEEDEQVEEEEVEENAEAMHVDNESDHVNNASDSDKDNALPSDLSPSLIAALERIKEFAKNHKSSSQKFFREPVNKLLLSIEIKLVNSGVRKKNRVYNHLSQHLPCGTQTLIKRGKNLLAERLEQRMKPAIKKLKDAIDEAMPPLIEAHALECQKIAEQKGEGPDHPEDENTTMESNKKLKLPKKKFVFTPHLKALFLDIVRTGSQRWNWMRKRSETAESYVKSFIDSHLKNLWPKGWVTTKFLYKESQPAHAFITAKVFSKKKAAMALKNASVLDGGMVSDDITPQNPESKGSSTQFGKAETFAEANYNKSETLSEALLSPSPPKQDVEERNPVVPIITAQSKDLKPQEKSIHEFSNSIKRPVLVKKDLVERPALSKNTAPQVVKLNPPKSSAVIISPPKDSAGGKSLVESQAMASVSPASESSPKSFHGFESPTKSHDIHRSNEVSSAKQSLVFDSVKKSSRISVEQSDSLPLVREGKPPKPSLTATALPKISVANTHTFSKADGSRKLHAELSDSLKTSKEDRKTITCITVKSVEKINETVATTSKSDKGKDISGPVPVSIALTSPREKRPPTLPETSLPAGAGGGVRVIDLSKDDDSGRKKGASAPASALRKELIGSIGSSVSVQSISESNKSQGASSQVSSTAHISSPAAHVSATAAHVSSTAAHVSSSSSPTKTDSFSKNNKLQQEMDQVMNELLQISKKNLNSTGTEELPSKHVTGSLPAVVVEPRKSPTASRSLEQEMPSNPSQQQKIISNPPQQQKIISNPPQQQKIISNPPQQQKIISNPPQQQKIISNPPQQQKIISNPPQQQKMPSNPPQQQKMPSNPPQQQKRPSSHSSSQGLTRTSPVTLMPYDLTTKPSATTQSSKSSFISDANDIKNQAPIHAYPKQSSSSHVSKNPDLSSLQQSSHSTNPQYASNQHAVHQAAISSSHSVSKLVGSQSSVKQIDGPPRVPPNSSGHSSYQNNSSSRTAPSQGSYIRPTVPSSNTSAGNQGTSSSHGSSHRSSPSHHTAPPSMTSPTHRMTPPSGSSRSQSSSHSNHRTSPSTHSGSQRPSNSSSHGLSSSHHRSSSQSTSHRLSTSSHSENHGSSSHSSSSSHVSASSRDTGASQVRGYPSSNSSGTRPSQSGLAGLPHGSTHTASHSSSSSSSKPSQSSSLRSPNPMHNISSRSSKPSHNIEGLLYDSSTKTNSSVNLTYTHSQHSSHHSQSHPQQQPSATQRTQARFAPSTSGSWTQEPSLTIRSSSSSSKSSSGSIKSPTPSKHKSTDNSYSTGSSNDPLANLRLMEGLSVSNVPKKSQSLSVCPSATSRPLGTSSSSSSQRTNSSVQPKIKQRSDSFSLSMPAHPLFGNLTAEQQQEFWQQMNATGGYLPGISPDVYKYMPQQGLYQGSNSTGSSSKKSSQY